MKNVLGRCFRIHFRLGFDICRNEGRGMERGRKGVLKWQERKNKSIPLFVLKDIFIRCSMLFNLCSVHPRSKLNAPHIQICICRYGTHTHTHTRHIEFMFVSASTGIERWIKVNLKSNYALSSFRMRFSPRSSLCYTSLHTNIRTMCAECKLNCQL